MAQNQYKTGSWLSKAGVDSFHAIELQTTQLIAEMAVHI